MPTRLITPSQLSLFSISPVIGSWWEELQARKLFERSKPEPSELEKQLRSDGERHEEVLLERLETRGHSIARLLGKHSDADYDATQDAMRRGVAYIHLSLIHI